jgi:ligand-binding sensor domain-containing protein
MLTSRPFFLLAAIVITSLPGFSQASYSLVSNSSYVNFASNENSTPTDLKAEDLLSWRRSSKDSVFVLHKNGSFAKWANEAWSELIWYFEGATNLFIDRDDNVWLLSNQIGLHKYSHGRFSFWGNTSDPETKGFIPSANLYDMTQDNKGVYWICSDAGLLKFDGKDFVVLDSKAVGPASVHTRSIVIDKKGTLWIGTADKGLSSFDGKTWKHYNMKNSNLKSYHIPQLAIDPDGHLRVSHLPKSASGKNDFYVFKAGKKK